MAAGKQPVGRHHDAESARLKDLVVRSYLVQDRNNYKDSVFASAATAH
jgi:hypothetical protein